MKEAQVILNRLLDKFENSKHLSEPNTSRRRVMLRIDKRELPEYQYEDAVVRDAYNIAARELEQQALVRLEWARKQSVLACIVLDLERVAQCYECADRVHPQKKGRRGCKHHHAEAGRQSRSMDRGMEGCCMCSGAEQHESADVLQRKRRSAAGAFAHVSTVCGAVRQCDDACIQQPVFSRYQVF